MRKQKTSLMNHLGFFARHQSLGINGFLPGHWVAE
jgi:hypothetical protein